MSAFPPSPKPLDALLGAACDALATLCARPAAARAYPGQAADQLNDAQRRRSAGYMRVNHAGEVCAQALYTSQALTSRNPQVRAQFHKAAAEERDHLAWCAQRLDELGGRPSRLNPLWYAGAFALGSLAGLAGERWNLGFIAATEQQVTEHLETHLGLLPDADARSREIVRQMQEDEARHAEHAEHAGAALLPGWVQRAMRRSARVMTGTAYYV